jgi:hypothetical protein
MITEAYVILRCGRTQHRMKMTDSHGIAVGNEYFFNIDGSTKEWTIIKIESEESNEVQRDH